MPLDQSQVGRIDDGSRLRGQPHEAATPCGSRIENRPLFKYETVRHYGGAREGAGRPLNEVKPPRQLGVRWFVAATHPQAEPWARRNLNDQGWEAWYPTCLVRRRDRVLRTLVHLVQAPLYGGYVFIPFDRDRDPWGPILQTRGVARLLMDGVMRPAPCEVGAVEWLQEGEAERCTKSPSSTGVKFKRDAAIVVNNDASCVPWSSRGVPRTKWH